MAIGERRPPQLDGRPGYLRVDTVHQGDLDGTKGVYHINAVDTAFYQQHFNPYLNFHRPCGVPERVASTRGKVKKIYRWYATPWEILRQLTGIAGYRV